MQPPTLGARLYNMQCRVASLPGKLRGATGQLGVAHAALLSGLVIAGALVFLGLSGRYEFIINGSVAARGDRLTGSLALCLPVQREEHDADGKLVGTFTRFECTPKLKQ